MSFRGKYQVVSARSDGECQPFRALQISTGQPVLVHCLPLGGTPPHLPDLESLIFRFLRIALAEQSARFLDMGEDEGRIFVVTEDVAECLDLRKWLQSVTEEKAGNASDAQAAEKSPDPGKIEFTQNFTTAALRQIARSSVSAPNPSSLGVRVAEPEVPPPEKSPGGLTPLRTNAEVQSNISDRGRPSFPGSLEESAPRSSAGRSGSSSTPHHLPKSPNGPLDVTAEFLTRRSSPSINDAPTVAMETLAAQAANRKRAPAAMAEPAEVKANVGRIVELVPTNPEVRNPPVAPAAPGPDTETPVVITEPSVESNLALQQSASPLRAQDKTETGGEKVPRRQAPMGFEVVFQSSKPRSRSPLSAPANKSGIIATPPHVAPVAVTPAAGMTGGSPAIGAPWPPGEQRPAVVAKKDPIAPPRAPLAQPAINESEKVTRLAPAPPLPPAKTAAHAPPDSPASTVRAMPPVSAPRPAAPNRGQSGDYTQMIENIKVAAGPLPLGVPAGYPPAANRGVPASAPAHASYFGVPASQPLPYRETPPQFRPSGSIAYAAPMDAAGKRFKVWVPVLILSCLLLMAFALVLFFAFRH